MNEPSWELYRTFLGVLEHGSLSGAARELGLTQPTVGRHIDALERSVGAELFTRSQTGLSPTDLAVELQPYATALAANAAALLRAASQKRDEIAGTVRVSASEIVAVEVIPPILAGLQDRHPALRIELSASDEVEDLLHRQSDVAVRMAEPSQTALVVRRIGGIPVGLFAHRRYLDRHGTPKTLAELAGHRVIGFDRKTAYIRAMTKRLPQFANLAFALRTDSNLAQLAAIRAGAGIGMCQVALADDAELVRVLPRAVELGLDTFVAMHENLRASPRCRAVFDALVAGLTSYVKVGRRR